MTFSTKLLCWVVLCLCLGTACDKKELCVRPIGKPTQRHHSVGTATKIVMNAQADLYLSTGATSDLKVKGSSSLVDNIDVSVENGTIYVNAQQCMFPSDILKLKIYLTLPLLEGVEINSRCNVVASDPITVGQDLALVVGAAGHSTLLMAANVHRAQVKVEGTGHIKLAADHAELIQATIASNSDLAAIDLLGYSQELELSISKRSGLCRAYDMPVEKATVNISGRGECRLEASTQLHVDIAGQGKVWYKGSPNIITNITGVGTVEPAL